jgi:hypothetical protein
MVAVILVFPLGAFALHEQFLSDSPPSGALGNSWRILSRPLSILVFGMSSYLILTVGTYLTRTVSQVLLAVHYESGGTGGVLALALFLGHALPDAFVATFLTSSWTNFYLRERGGYLDEHEPPPPPEEERSRTRAAWCLGFVAVILGAHLPIPPSGPIYPSHREEAPPVSQVGMIAQADRRILDYLDPFPGPRCPPAFSMVPNHAALLTLGVTSWHTHLGFQLHLEGNYATAYSDFWLGRH